MNKQDKTILVTGATGQQGGAVVRQLLKRDWIVRAFVRDANKPNAQALANAGVELAQGDLEHPETLQNAMDGVYGVFSFPNMAMGLEKEIKYGKRVADIAKSAGVKHFVQSSVGGAERNSNVPHFESKRQIELYLDEIGLPATILRPVYFMENLNWKREQILNGALESMGLDSGKTIQLISVEDIGRFTAIVFEDPTTYVGQEIEIAGDELTEAQMVDVFSKILDRSVELTPLTTTSLYEDMAVMYQWFNDYGYTADLDELRIMNEELTSFEEWVVDSNWVVQPI